MTKIKDTQHVVPASDGCWVVRKGGSYRASKRFPTQREAEEWARQIAINHRAELVIHKRDGTILSKDTFGNDPLPPKDHR